MSFEALQERLTALQETTSQVRDLIDRLATLDFQPGSVPLPVNDDGDDENVATELAAEINQILREEEEDLELLSEEVTDLRGGKEGSEAARRKERLREGVTRLEGEVKSCRVAFHKAQLTARRSLEAARRLERQVLLQSYAAKAAALSTTSLDSPSRSAAGSPAPTAHHLPRRHGTHRSQRNNNGTSSDDPVVGASSDLTRSLHRARQLVQDELARSVALHDHLVESTSQLRQLEGAYGRVGDMLSSSRDLLGALLTSAKSDTWYLQTTFYMLASTLAWLVFRRWLYGPLWWLVWLPLRIVFRTGSTAVGIAGRGVGAGTGASGAATMRIVDGSGTRVEIEMGEDAVPTIEVSSGGGGEKESVGDPDSLVEKVGRILDGDGVGDEQLFVGQEELREHVNGQTTDGDAAVHDGRVRDEL